MRFKPMGVKIEGSGTQRVRAYKERQDWAIAVHGDAIVL